MHGMKVCNSSKQKSEIEQEIKRECIDTEVTEEMEENLTFGPELKENAI